MQDIKLCTLFLLHKDHLSNLFLVLLTVSFLLVLSLFFYFGLKFSSLHTFQAVLSLACAWNTLSLSLSGYFICLFWLEGIGTHSNYSHPLVDVDGLVPGHPMDTKICAYSSLAVNSVRPVYTRSQPEIYTGFVFHEYCIFDPCLVEKYLCIRGLVRFQLCCSRRSTYFISF